MPSKGMASAKRLIPADLPNDLVNSIIETPAVGAYVTVKDGNVAKYSASVDGTETIVMEVIANTTLSGEKAVQLLVV